MICDNILYYMHIINPPHAGCILQWDTKPCFTHIGRFQNPYHSCSRTTFLTLTQSEKGLLLDVNSLAVTSQKRVRRKYIQYKKEQLINATALVMF